MGTLMIWKIVCANCGKIHLMGEVVEMNFETLPEDGEFCLSPTLGIVCGCGVIIESEPDDREPSGWASFITEPGRHYRQYLKDRERRRPRRN